MGKPYSIDLRERVYAEVEERWLGLFEQFPGLSKWEPLPGLGRRE
jgi:hypothetical protein